MALMRVMINLWLMSQNDCKLAEIDTLLYLFSTSGVVTIENTLVRRCFTWCKICFCFWLTFTCIVQKKSGDCNRVVRRVYLLRHSKHFIQHASFTYSQLSILGCFLCNTHIHVLTNISENKLELMILPRDI